MTPWFTRRSVLQQVSALAAFAGCRSAFRNIARAETTRREAYWELVRRQFIFPETAVPINSADLCPSFKSVSEKVTALARVVQTRPVQRHAQGVTGKGGGPVASMRDLIKA